MKMKYVLFLFFCNLLVQKITARSKYVKPEEDNPYEFGFTIDGQQHRHEKKDVNGIIQGEFGFITADGVYHVTVYATDENGNYKILSMRNVRISGPLDQPNAQLPDTSQFSKDVPKTVAAVAPNPLSIEGPKTPIQSITPRPNQFTTLPTEKPACAGCGYVKLNLPNNNNNQNKNKLNFQTNAFNNNNNKQGNGIIGNNNPPNTGSNYPNNNRGNVPGLNQGGNKPYQNGNQFNQGGNHVNKAGNPPYNPYGNNEGNNPPSNTYPAPGGNPADLVNPLSLPETFTDRPPAGVTVTGNKIQVPNNPPITIQDKYPNMVNGLPAGISKDDITGILYKFNYTVGFHGHYEKGYKNGAKVGGYFVTDRDGVSRVVTYVADELGYRPKVKLIRLDLTSDLVPKEGTEKTFGLKNFEFVWYPLN